MLKRSGQLQKAGLLILFLFSVLTTGNLLQAQISSCAGPDYPNNYRIRTMPAGTWQLGLTHEYKSLSRLVMEKRKLADATRARSTRALIFETYYALSNSISLTALLSLVQKNHTINMPVIGKDYLLTRGLGDGYLSVGYRPIPWNAQSGRMLSFNAGIKFPFGESSLARDGVLIAPDMQPGTGSVDAMGGGGLVQRIHPWSPASLALAASYRLNGVGSQKYRFGNEFTGSIAALFFSGSNSRFTAGVKYVTIGKSKQFSDSEVPNTGGRWLYLVGSLDADFNQKIRWEFSIQVPASQELEGTQLSTSYEYSVSILYLLNH